MSGSILLCPACWNRWNGPAARTCPLPVIHDYDGPYTLPGDLLDRLARIIADRYSEPEPRSRWASWRLELAFADPDTLDDELRRAQAEVWRELRGGLDA